MQHKNTRNAWIVHHSHHADLRIHATTSRDAAHAVHVLLVKWDGGSRSDTKLESRTCIGVPLLLRNAPPRRGSESALHAVSLRGDHAACTDTRPGPS